jgi:hypothetical protein
MKRFTAAILAIIYVFATTGFVADTHYCMGKIASVEIDHFGKAFCNICGSNHSCCRHEVKVYKLNVDHKQVANNFALNTPNPISKALSAYLDFSFSVKIINTEAIANAPPLISTNPIFLLNGVFRI